MSASIPLNCMMAEITNSVLKFWYFPLALFHFIPSAQPGDNTLSSFCYEKRFRGLWINHGLGLAHLSGEKITSLGGEMASLKEQSVISANKNAGGWMREFLSSRKRQIILLGAAYVSIWSPRKNRFKIKHLEAIQNYGEVPSSIIRCKPATKKILLPNKKLVAEGNSIAHVSELTFATISSVPTLDTTRIFFFFFFSFFLFFSLSGVAPIWAMSIAHCDGAGVGHDYEQARREEFDW